MLTASTARSGIYWPGVKICFLRMTDELLSLEAIFVWRAESDYIYA